MSSVSNQAAIEKQQDGGESQYSSLPKHKTPGAPLHLQVRTHLSLSSSVLRSFMSLCTTCSTCSASLSVSPVRSSFRPMADTPPAVSASPTEQSACCFHLEKRKIVRPNKIHKIQTKTPDSDKVPRIPEFTAGWFSANWGRKRNIFTKEGVLHYFIVLYSYSYEF